jgi:hypothetical protein
VISSTSSEVLESAEPECSDPPSSINLVMLVLIVVMVTMRAVDLVWTMSTPKALRLLLSYARRGDRRFSTRGEYTSIDRAFAVDVLTRLEHRRLQEDVMS